MATLNKFEIFAEDLASGVHDLAATGDTLKLYLTNTLPNASTDAVKGDLAGITEENGYAPADVQNDISNSSGTVSVTGVDVTWTASGGSFGPFRYVILYNDSTAAKTDPLIGYYDYGSSITVSDGEDFLADIGTSLFTVA